MKVEKWGEHKKSRGGQPEVHMPHVAWTGSVLHARSGRGAQQKTEQEAESRALNKAEEGDQSSTQEGLRA